MTRHYVYRCFTQAGYPLYVGMTNNVDVRRKYHGTAPWAEQVGRTKITVHQTKRAARAVEVDEINRLEPLYNGEVHLFDTIDWDRDKFFDHVHALAKTVESEEVAEAHPINRLAVYYRRKYGRSLLNDIGPLMIKRRGRINDTEPVPVLLRVRGVEPWVIYPDLWIPA